MDCPADLFLSQYDSDRCAFILNTGVWIDKSGGMHKTSSGGVAYHIMTDGDLSFAGGRRFIARIVALRHTRKIFQAQNIDF
jgi:hypothetical protein